MNLKSTRVWFRIILIGLALGLLGYQLVKTGRLPDWRVALAAGAAILYALFRFGPRNRASGAEKAEDYGFHLAEGPGTQDSDNPNRPSPQA